MALSTVQERLQNVSTPTDKWSTREKLCLSSAVCCSGDQNWMTVSRTMKLVCSSGSRPADWFSQKSCAVQYGHLLENAETSKRKKRASESANDSPVPTETPTDMIFRRLTEERVQEVKAEIRREQEEYAKIYNELKTIQSGQLNEEQLLEMWRDIEKEQEMQRIEEMKWENQMREREQQRQEMQRTWRTGGTATAVVVTQAPTVADATASSAVIDMDVEEAAENASILSTGNQSQQQQPVIGTSPLLSSLLKSPTPGNNTPVAANSARASAPTITTLLTSGSIPHSNQPTITLKSHIPADTAMQLLTRPISGPPVDATATASAGPQNLLSPSQSAPTLSMLLEKNKTAGVTSEQSSSVPAQAASSSKAATSAAVDSNNEEVPMDIEEDVHAPANATSNVDLVALDSDETDPEEQQLLEVFKNIGNIELDDIDVADVIDDEEVFLKGVDESPQNETLDFETKQEAGDIAVLQEAVVDTKNDIKTERELINTETNTTSSAKPEVIKIEEEDSKTKVEKVETISSDDSNDNIPLSAVASFEHKERQHTPDEKTFLKQKVESTLKNDDTEATPEVEEVKSESNVDITEDNDESKYNDNIMTAAHEGQTKNSQIAQKSPAESESSDVIVIPTDDDESNSDKQMTPQQPEGRGETSGIAASDVVQREIEKKSGAVEDDLRDSINLSNNVETLEGLSSTEATNPAAHTVDSEISAQAPPTISIADTTDEDDSSTTDVSIITRKDDKPIAPVSTSIATDKPAPALTLLTPQQRRSLHESGTRQETIKPPTNDEDTATSLPATTSTATPVRPPMLRKLRDRDRSESPMIDGGETSTTNTTSTTSDHFNTATATQRSRRRYSSTPVIDSIPNSPASSDRDDQHEARASKKSLLSIYHALQHNRNATLMQRAFNTSDEHLPKYDEVCLRHMDWPTIRRNIESGIVRSVSELQRDILLMCQNALMLCKTSSSSYKAALAFQHECQTLREFAASPHVSEHTTKPEREVREGKSLNTSNSSGVKVRGSSRKSTRIS